MCDCWKIALHDLCVCKCVENVAFSKSILNAWLEQQVYQSRVPV